MIFQCFEYIAMKIIFANLSVFFVKKPVNPVLFYGTLHTNLHNGIFIEENLRIK